MTTRRQPNRERQKPLEQHRRVLRERAARLARRTAEPQAALQSCLMCEVGDDLVALPLDAVARIKPLMRLGAAPAAHPAWLGLGADAGSPLNVYALDRLLGLPARTRGQAGDYLLILRGGRTALCVDRRPEAALVQAEPDGDAPRVRVNDPGSDIHSRTAALVTHPDLLSPAPVQTEALRP